MKVLTVNPSDQEVKELDIVMEANTVYSFFSSILIDHLSTLKDHTIYTDANAFSNNKKAFFIGEQLLIGDALITGLSNENTEIDTSIPINELEELIDYELNDFYIQTLELLSKTDINLYRTFSCTKNNEKYQLNIEWVLYTFNIADERTKVYFLEEMKKNLQDTNQTQKFLEKMAQLALNAA